MKRQGPLLSRSVVIADIPKRGLDVKIEASPEERERIAREFELPSLNSLIATYHVVPIAGGVRARGAVTASLQQVCVISLDPFETEVSEEVDLTFADEPRHGHLEGLQGREISISPEEEDPAEPIVDGKIDLGAVSLEFLALGLDPYPRKPGVELAHRSPAEEKPLSPFAVLASRAGKGARKE
jgi:hypothetical protein